MISSILCKEKLNFNNLVSLLSTQDENDIELIFSHAREVRKKYCGEKIYLRGIIEFSNYCKQNCLYCGLRKSNKVIQRYRMTEKEILSSCDEIYHSGIRTIVLQSGEDDFYTREIISSIISKIKFNYPDCAITLSVGERDFSDYSEWYEAGADRYLLKHETANDELYSLIHNKQKLSARIVHLIKLKEIGYQIGSGNIIGLPYQTIEDIAEDILLCDMLDIDMASFSPFIPSENTPLKSVNAADLLLTLKTMAVARIYLKNVHIPATTALATLKHNGRELGLHAGANIVMPSFTPHPYRTNYAIYNGKKCITEIPGNCVSCLSLMANAQGLKIGDDAGHSLKINFQNN